VENIVEHGEVGAHPALLGLQTDCLQDMFEPRRCFFFDPPALLRISVSPSVNGGVVALRPVSDAMAECSVVQACFELIWVCDIRFEDKTTVPVIVKALCGTGRWSPT
jgi:hypothetical protein